MLSKKEKDNRMFQTLAKNNVKMNARNYTIYFMTLTFSVAMLYTFNSIGAQFGMLNLSNEGSYLSFSAGMMAGVSLLICLIMGFLVVYVNRFLMERRKKELGLYITLGMTQKEMSDLLFRETVIIGGASLVAGLILGIIFSQGLTLITIRFMQVQGVSYRFVFSPIAVVECIVFYTCMFAFINKFNNHTIKNSTLLDLLRADQKNEQVSQQGVGRDLLKLLLSFACFGFAYVVALIDGFNIKYISLAVVIIFVGTFLFFRSIANMILYWTHKNKKLYYKDLNMFAVHQISSKMNSTNTTLTVICLLLFLSFTTLAVGLGLSMDITAGMDKMTSADAVIMRYEEKGQNGTEETITKVLEEKGIHVDEMTANAAEIQLFQQSQITLKSFLTEQTPGRKSLLKNDYLGWNSSPDMMKVSDFNKIREQQGLDPITLSDQQFAINYNVIPLNDLYKSYGEEARSIEIGSEKLTLKDQGIYSVAYLNANILADQGTLIVPDKMVQNAELARSILNCNFDKGNKKEENSFSDAFYAENMGNMEMITKSGVITEITSTNMTLSYIAVYLGIIFLISACAVLALQQISNTVDSGKRYETLRRLGAEKSHMTKALAIQICIYFGVPLAVGLLHSVVAITVMYRRLVNVTPGQIAWNVLFATVLLLGVYGSYFFITCINSKHAQMGTKF